MSFVAHVCLKMAARLLLSRSLSRCFAVSSRQFSSVLRTQLPAQTRSVSAGSCAWWSRETAVCHRATWLTRTFATEALTVEELQERLLNTIKLFEKVNPEKVTMEAHFINDLGLDSLDVVEIVMFLEDEFDVEITDDESEKLFVLEDVFALLKRKKSLE